MNSSETEIKNQIRQELDKIRKEVGELIDKLKQKGVVQKYL
jgi:biotin operon repressor